LMQSAVDALMFFAVSDWIHETNDNTNWTCFIYEMLTKHFLELGQFDQLNQMITL
jgi:hypothetical protein